MKLILLLLLSLDPLKPNEPSLVRQYRKHGTVISAGMTPKELQEENKRLDKLIRERKKNAFKVNVVEAKK